MAIVINSTNYTYDHSEMHAPILRTSEIPEVLRNSESGGILSTEGVIDVVRCLRYPTEASLAGGVFLVIECSHSGTWRFLEKKGHILSKAGERGLIYKPYHLLGVETPLTVLKAASGILRTEAFRQKIDVVARAATDLHAGTTLSMAKDHSIFGVSSEFAPSAAPLSNSPIPIYLAAGGILSRDISAGSILTYDMVQGVDADMLDLITDI